MYTANVPSYATVLTSVVGHNALCLGFLCVLFSTEVSFLHVLSQVVASLVITSTAQLIARPTHLRNDLPFL